MRHLRKFETFENEDFNDFNVGDVVYCIDDTKVNGCDLILGEEYVITHASKGENVTSNYYVSGKFDGIHDPEKSYGSWRFTKSKEFAEQLVKNKNAERFDL